MSKTEPRVSNRLLKAHLSLIENVQSPVWAPVDLADYILTTDACDSMHLILEKEFFSKTDQVIKTFSTRVLPPETKVVWLVLKIGKSGTSDLLIFLGEIMKGFCDHFPDYHNDAILADAYNDELQVHSLEIIAFS